MLDLFLPAFVACFVVSVVIIVPVCVWLVRKNKRHGLIALPSGIQDYKPIEWTVHRSAKIFGALAIVCLLIFVLGFAFAPMEWRSVELIFLFLVFPFVWAGVIFQMRPLKCITCGTHMKRYCEETQVGSSEAINVYLICSSCKTVHKERRVL